MRRTRIRDQLLSFLHFAALKTNPAVPSAVELAALVARLPAVALGCWSAFSQFGRPIEVGGRRGRGALGHSLQVARVRREAIP